MAEKRNRQRPATTAATTAPAAAPRDVPMRPGRNGGMLRNGSLGRLGVGRKPDAFKAMCRALASRDVTLERVAEILSDPAHPMFIRALQWASENGYGKAAESLSVKHSGKLEVSFVREGTRGRT